MIKTKVMERRTAKGFKGEGNDALVVDDYYRDGKAINLSLAADDEARLREASAVLAFAASGEVREARITILGTMPEVLRLSLSHVTRADRRGTAA